ncbi:hypothetical protein D3C76_03430 [compost metagenome]
MSTNYVLDYLNAFVVSRKLIDEDISFDLKSKDIYFLYIDRICSLQISVYDESCTILYLDFSEKEADVFEDKIPKNINYKKHYRKIYRYRTFVIFEFFLYENNENTEILNIALRFISGEEE